ncbi:MAG: phenylacetate--CoA ligase family protein [Planctomycetota bacterium]|jgi:phenylacetate-CoA ligase
MLNWRKGVLNLVYFLAGNATLGNFRYIRSVESESAQKLKQLQDERLRLLLLHAHRNVPYYKDILTTAGVVKEGKVLLENFGNIPILTKEMLRSEGANLYSLDYRQRGFYTNHTGGSTGEPVNFIQDKKYKSWGLAHQYYFHMMGGRDLGEGFLKLWGSGRDVFTGSEKLSNRIQNWLSKVLVFNSFLMSEEAMAEYVRKWNSFKPKLVLAYTSSIQELARYIQRSVRKVSTPAAVFCAAETLTEDVRRFIEEVVGCPVLNQYGSRESGAIACECLRKEGLHVFELHNKVEILDSQGQQCKSGQIGDVILTTLNNYSMPLIRYNIGDTAIPASDKSCSCGRGWSLIEKVTGRQMEVFRTKQGTSIPGEFFIHAIGVVYNKGYIRKFQVVQDDYDHITVRVVVEDEAAFNNCKGPLVDSVKKVMGTECRVEFELVDDIKPTASGKFQYTISRVASQ